MTDVAPRWPGFEACGRRFYVDINMSLDALYSSADVIKGDLDFVRSHARLQEMGQREIDDFEYCHAVGKHEKMSELMPLFGIWTGLLMDVVWEPKHSVFQARYIARPVKNTGSGGPLIIGAEKPIKLPKSGWFKIAKLLDNEYGLPDETFNVHPNEPAAYFDISEGALRPIQRGGHWMNRDKKYGIVATWEVTGYQRPHIGMWAASDTETMATS